MKRIVAFFILVAPILILLSGSCREDFEFRTSTGNLTFSKDTVFLDTVFSSIGSSTYTLKVYNNSDDDIVIPEVRLGGGEESSYRLNVDGVPGRTFNNVPLLARDSLFVFIETTFDITTTGEVEFLHTDTIVFGSSGTPQEVHLVTLVRDAVFLYPRTLSDGSTETISLGVDEEGNAIRVEGFLLSDEELNFTNTKPYVIYGYAAVEQGKTLSMEAGTRVHFHNNSGIFVGAGGQLEINGEVSEDREMLENEVIFEGDRLEPRFEDVPGQWGTLWLAEGSANHSIRNLTIKNATVGMLVEGDGDLEDTHLNVQNAQIYNSAVTNLWAITAKVDAENCVFGSSGSASVYINQGGDHDFTHCTIANYWINGFRNIPGLFVDNFSSPGTTPSQGADLVNATFSNCVVDGNRSREIGFASNGSNTFNFLFVNSSLRFLDTSGDPSENPFYDFENPMLFQDILLNARTDFEDPIRNRFVPTGTSQLLDAANVAIAQQVPFDLLGNDRTQNPDMGAIEVIFNN